MFVFLSKLIPQFIYPAGLTGVLLAAAWLSRKRKAKNRLILFAMLTVWILGNGWVASALVRSLERQYLPQQNYPTAGAIVILGGGTQPADYPRPSVEVNGAGDRVLYGARLFNQRKAPLIVVSGSHLPWTDTKSSPAEEMLALLTAIGVPADAVLLEDASLNTYENAVYTRRLLAPMGIDHILLVTSAMHMPRAVRLFENQGFTVTPAPTDFRVTDRSGEKPFSQIWPDTLISLLPSAGAISGTTDAMKEYIGIAVYWARGWW